jgi:hypothetical protein
VTGRFAPCDVLPRQFGPQFPIRRHVQDELTLASHAERDVPLALIARIADRDGHPQTAADFSQSQPCGRASLITTSARLPRRDTTRSGRHFTFAMYYNFVRIHKTLRTTPAMAANVTERLWEIGDIVNVLEAWEAAK